MFHARLFCARLREIRGDFSGAADLMEGLVPDRYRSLRDAYRLRMLVLANNPRVGLSIIEQAERFSWFQDPQSATDQYARLYCKYVAAGVRGDAKQRKQYSAELGILDVPNIYRHSLKVT